MVSRVWFNCEGRNLLPLEVGERRAVLMIPLKSPHCATESAWRFPKCFPSSFAVFLVTFLRLDCLFATCFWIQPCSHRTANLHTILTFFLSSYAHVIGSRLPTRCSRMSGPLPPSGFQTWNHCVAFQPIPHRRPYYCQYLLCLLAANLASYSS